jgi:hypothetical protein
MSEKKIAISGVEYKTKQEGLYLPAKNKKKLVKKYESYKEQFENEYGNGVVLMKDKILFDGTKFHSLTENKKFSYPKKFNIFELPLPEQYFGSHEYYFMQAKLNCIYKTTRDYVYEIEGADSIIWSKRELNSEEMILISKLEDKDKPIKGQKWSSTSSIKKMPNFVLKWMNNNGKAVYDVESVSN